MRQGLASLVAVAAFSAFVGEAGATTVTFNVVPTADPTATSVTAAPGAEVPYQLFAQVISDTAGTPDNNGLSFFSVDITTNLGVTQQPLDSFDPQIATTFTVTQSLGTPQGGNVLQSNIVQIGGGQNTFAGGTVRAGIGTGNTPTLLGTGRFLTSTTVGSYSVGVASTSQANVFLPVSLSSAKQATVTTGPGFTIIVTPSTTPSTTPTVQFSVVPTSNINATSVTVAPGATVPYQIYVQVTSGSTTTTDNNGLASFTLSVLTNLGTAQQPLSSFSTAINQAFPNNQSLGTPQGSDIIGISAAQNTSGTVTPGIGSQRQLIGQGQLVAPTTEASYTVGIGPNPQATVFGPGSTSSTITPTVQAGSGFTIVVSSSSGGGGTSNGGEQVLVAAVAVGFTILAVASAFLGVTAMFAVFVLEMLLLLWIWVASNLG
jgi:hypothetical protein